MNGILNILKPPAMTSQDVVSYVKKLLKENKAGHTGTLDPGAAGVLPVTLGKATRISQYLLNDKKSYRAEMALGLKSDTLDKYGAIESIDAPALSKELLLKAFDKFRGRIYQTPPMYSAVKVGGRKLYELAREGIVIERKAREAYIYDIKLLNFKDYRVLFDVTCSKGTYIRSLCSDIGKYLGSDAIMTFLMRRETGPFSINNSVTLYELKEAVLNGSVESMIYPVHAALPEYSRVYVDSNTARKVKNGVGFDVEYALRYDHRECDSVLLIFDESETFIATARKDKSGFAKVDKVFS